MTRKLIASAFAISAAFAVPALGQGVEGTAPGAPGALGLPATVTGVTLPATNLLLVGGVLVAAAGLVAAGGDSTNGTTGTTSTTSTTSTVSTN